MWPFNNSHRMYRSKQIIREIIISVSLLQALWKVGLYTTSLSFFYMPTRSRCVLFVTQPVCVKHNDKGI